MNKVVRKLKQFAAELIPNRWLRIVARPMVAPRAYAEIVSEAERIVDLQRIESFDKFYWTQLLRKNVHMIDKGLQRDDCEPGHSSPIYKKTIEILAHLDVNESLEDPSVSWAAETLSEYRSFQETGVPTRVPAATWPAYNCLLEGIKSRRSIRSFREERIDIELLNKVLEPLPWAASSCNRQPARVYATLDPDLVVQCMANCSGATGFSSFVPAFLCFCADRRAYAMPREIWLPVLDTALGIQNCALTAHSLGLSLTLLSWAAHSPQQDKGLRKLLGIPEHYQIVVNAVMGFPKRGVPAPLRKPFAQTLVLRSRANSE